MLQHVVRLLPLPCLQQNLDVFSHWDHVLLESCFDYLDTFGILTCFLQDLTLQLSVHNVDGLKQILNAVFYFILVEIERFLLHVFR